MTYWEFETFRTNYGARFSELCAADVALRNSSADVPALVRSDAELHALRLSLLF